MAIAHLTKQSITIAAPTGTLTRQGKMTFDDAVSYNARVERTQKTISTPEKEREPIDAIVFIETSDTITKGSKLVYDSQNYRVMSVSDVVGSIGSRHHYELMCQLWNI